MCLINKTPINNNTKIVIFEQLDLTSEVPADKLRLFLEKVANNYRRVPYHNFTHAFCLACFAYWIIRHIEVGKFFEKEDILSIMLAWIGHDLNHPGMNNGYFIKTNDNLSSLISQYIDDDKFTSDSGENDQVLENFKNHNCSSEILSSLGLDHNNSVLENMHLRIMLHFLDILPEEKTEYVKQVIAEGVLWTDMSKHGSLITKLKALRDRCKDEPNYEFTKEERVFMAAMIVHAWDLCNLIFEYDHSFKWGIRITQEFHDQYQAESKLDKEKYGSPPAFLKYSKEQDFYKSQSGFMENVIMPMWEILFDILKFDKVVMENLESNRQRLVENSQ